ncbi:MAG: HD domain-containing protein [Deltaproteobacteria bacterium]|nr:HD domain-containing protein [Deltaproteobacteria bacterium]
MTHDSFEPDRLIFNLNALAELGEEVTSQKDFQRVVKSSLYMVMGTFYSSRGAIFRYDCEKRSVHAIVSKGVASDSDSFIPINAEAVEWMVGLNEPVDIKSNGPFQTLFGPAVGALGEFGARIIAPLVVKDELLGFISLNEKFSGEEFTHYDMRLLSAMSRHIAVSLHSHSLLKKLVHKYSENKDLYESLQSIYYNTIHAFAAAIDAKDAYTNGHSNRVSSYCVAVAREMGITGEAAEGIRIGGLLHDIGKLAVDKTIINKATSLTTNEYIEINSHPVVGYEILSKIKFPWKGVARMARNHHERPDGTGYPDRLKNDSIPIEARIMSLVDAFDAMTTDRPYRRRLSFAEAVGEIRDNIGAQFDSGVARPFLSVIRKEVAGEVYHPTVTPLLRDSLSLSDVTRLMDGFPAG